MIKTYILYYVNDIEELKLLYKFCKEIITKLNINLNFGIHNETITNFVNKAYNGHQLTPISEDFCFCSNTKLLYDYKDEFFVFYHFNAYNLEAVVLGFLNFILWDAENGEYKKTNSALINQLFYEKSFVKNLNNNLLIQFRNIIFDNFFSNYDDLKNYIIDFDKNETRKVTYEIKSSIENFYKILNCLVNNKVDIEKETKKGKHSNLIKLFIDTILISKTNGITITLSELDDSNFKISKKYENFDYSKIYEISDDKHHDFTTTIFIYFNSLNTKLLTKRLDFSKFDDYNKPFFASIPLTFIAKFHFLTYFLLKKEKLVNFSFLDFSEYQKYICVNEDSIFLINHQDVISIVREIAEKKKHSDMLHYSYKIILNNSLKRISGNDFKNSKFLNYLLFLENEIFEDFYNKIKKDNALQN